MHEKQKLKELMTISGKTDFKPKVVKRDWKVHFTLINRRIQEVRTAINIYVSNVDTPNFINTTGHKSTDKHKHKSTWI
jgi:hypothetical protein